MIEVSPIKDTIKNILENLSRVRQGRGVSADVPTRERSFDSVKHFTAVLLHINFIMHLKMVCFSGLRWINKARTRRKHAVKSASKILQSVLPINSSGQTSMAARFYRTGCRQSVISVVLNVHSLPPNAMLVGYYIFNNKSHAD